MINCIAISEAENSIEMIRNHIKNIPELRLIQTFSEPFNALKFLEHTRIDLIFADLQLPHLSGLELIDAVREKAGSDRPSFVFIAANTDFAMHSYEHGACGYLLKPICFKRFRQTVDHLVNNWKNGKRIFEPPADFFFADSNGKKLKINFKDIAYVESAGNYVQLVGNKLNVMIYQSMIAMQQLLSSAQFIRVHKSYMISIDHIEAIKGNECIVKLETQKKYIPIGSTFKKNTYERLKIDC